MCACTTRTCCRLVHGCCGPTARMNMRNAWPPLLLHRNTPSCLQWLPAGWPVTGKRSWAANHRLGHTMCSAAASGEHETCTLPQRVQWDAYPTTATGRVMAAEANYVRVDVHQPGQPNSSSSSSSQPTLPLESQQQQGASTSAVSTDALIPPRRQLLCTVRALLKKVRQRVLVGDMVSVGGIDWAAGRGVVEGVLPRRSELVDPAVANVDHVVLMFGLTQPPFEEQQVSRFLVSIEATGLPLTLALNKADLLPEEEVQARIVQCASWGYGAVAVSCTSGRGLEQLGQALVGKTSVVAGPSGAGKSSLINALRLGRHREDEEEFGGGASWEEGVQWAVGDEEEGEKGEGGCVSNEEREGVSGAGSRNEAEQEGCSSGLQGQARGEDEQQQQQVVDRERALSGELAGSSGREHMGGLGTSTSSNGSGNRGAVSASDGFLAVGDMSKIGRGKHTTRVVRLIPLPGGGLMADTPGFGLPTLDGISSTGLAELFPEFRAARAVAPGGKCRFDDCMHVAEPGCAVMDAELERYPHYIKFLAEVKAREEYDVRVMQLAKRQREGAVKAKTGRGGETRFEARLESKKHRVTSRKKAKQSLMRLAAAEDEEDDEEGPR